MKVCIDIGKALVATGSRRLSSSCILIGAVLIHAQLLKSLFQCLMDQSLEFTFLLHRQRGRRCVALCNILHVIGALKVVCIGKIITLVWILGLVLIFLFRLFVVYLALECTYWYLIVIRRFVFKFFVAIVWYNDWC